MPAAKRPPVPRDPFRRGAAAASGPRGRRRQAPAGVTRAVRLRTGADGLAFVTEPLSGMGTFFSWLTLVSTSASQALCAPWNLFTGGLSGTADDWTIAVWAVSLVPFGCDLIFTFANFTMLTAMNS